MSCSVNFLKINRSVSNAGVFIGLFSLACMAYVCHCNAALISQCLPAVSITVNIRPDKAYRLSIQAIPAAVRSTLWTKWLPGFSWNTVSIPLRW